MDKAADTRYSVASVEEGAHAIQGAAPSGGWQKKWTRNFRQLVKCISLVY